MSEVASSFGHVETSLVTLSLTHAHVVRDNVLGSANHLFLVFDSLQFLVFHLASDGLAGIIRLGVVVVFQVLLLNRGKRVINSKPD